MYGQGAIDLSFSGWKNIRSTVSGNCLKFKSK